MTSTLEFQAESLAQKIRHYLITGNGRIANEASDAELYQAFCYAFREEIMINWLATIRTHAQNNVRTIYYLSMEYLPGRSLGNNITATHASDLVRLTLKKLGHDYCHLRSLEPDPGLGNGGLGRLASCFMDSLATLHYPSWGYGLRYHYGTFEQQLWDGVQIEKPDCWLFNHNPWEFRRDQRRMRIKFCGQIPISETPTSKEILKVQNFEEVRTLAYDIPIIGYSRTEDFTVTSLRLWTSKESPRNFELQSYNAGLLDQAAENMTLTDVLYPSDHHDTGKRIRLKQEFLLVSASLQDILRRHLSRDPNPQNIADKVRIQINDTHPALAVAELMRLLMKEGLSWDSAWEVTQSCLSYTNHTIMKEALEEWNGDLLAYLLPRQYRIIEELNQRFCSDVRATFPGDEERVRRMSILQSGHVRMAHLALYGSHRVNGVAALHTELLKSSVFKDFYEMYPDRFINVTNGVTHRRWLLHSNPELAGLISEKIGDSWVLDFSKIRELAKFACDPETQAAFLAVKRSKKQQLIDSINEQTLWRDLEGNAEAYPLSVSLDSIFDVQIKRVHEYKRQLMNALHLIMIYHEILDNPDCERVPRTVIFAGKAAAGYAMAKNIIRLICCLSRKCAEDPRIASKLQVLFLENYNVSKAEVIIPATELSQQISAAGWEASGTGNMKLSMNGALTIGTDDGANIEMREEVGDTWWPFKFGSSAPELAELRTSGSYNPSDIYQSDTAIQRAVDALRNHSLADTEDEHQSLEQVYYSLVEGHNGAPADPYFCLKDLRHYYSTQKRVEELYRDPRKWAEYSLHNIAGMGKFTTDNSIQRYCKEIWDLQSCPVDKEILRQVRNDYSEHDRCRVFVQST